jgi:uncharacterized protein (DUF2252 family)
MRVYAREDRVYDERVTGGSTHGHAVKDLLDVVGLAGRQHALDEGRTKRLPQLRARKIERMSASPLALLRGAAPLFYEVLAVRPDLAEGPPGEGWIVGDLHIENFGAYRPHLADDPDGDTKKPVVFNLNDFDDAMIGPWRFDLLRLTTSLLLGVRTSVESGAARIELVDRLLDAYCHAAFDAKHPTPEPPRPVAALMAQVRERSRAALLDGRTETAHGKRRFVRGPRYQNLPKEIHDEVPEAFATYVASTPKEERPGGENCLVIVDAALRVAGTGSLGALRVAVLTEGKGGPSGSYVFDLKEEGEPSGAILIEPPKLGPAERIIAGYRACIEHPPRMMGATHIGKTPLFGRRLSPQEDKLAFDQIAPKELPDLAAYLGTLVGRAHARGATKAPKTRWSASDRAAIRDRAFLLAGLHEAIYLAFMTPR